MLDTEKDTRDRCSVAVADDGRSYVLTIKGPKDDAGEDTTPLYSSTYGSWQNQLTDGRAPRVSWGHTMCTANDLNARVIKDKFGDRVEFYDEAAEIAFERDLLEFDLRNRCAEVHALWHAEHLAPSAAKLEINADLPLADYQRVPAAASRMTTGYALFMEQGTGKTPVVVCRVCTDAVEQREKLLEANAEKLPMYRVLVVCPKNVRLNWQNEFARFSTCAGKVTVLRGGPVKRIKSLAEAMAAHDGELFTVVIVSFGLLVQAWDNVLSHVPWDLAVVDEGHSIKADGTDRTQVTYKLRNNARRRMLLTGTPIVNWLGDLYSQLEFLDAGMSGYSSFNAFVAKHADLKRMGSRDIITAVKNVPALKKRLAQVSFIVRKDQVLKDLPEKQYDIVEVEMSKKQQEDYDQLEQSLYLEIERELEEAEDEGKRQMILNNALVKVMKLAQITSGFLIISAERGPDGEVIHERETHVYREQPKLDALVEELRLMPPLEKTLVWSCWQHDMQAIHDRLTAEGIDHVMFHGGTSDKEREVAIERINGDPSCRVLVGNPEAGGVGLNLLGYMPGVNDDMGTNVTRMIYYGQGWKPVHRWQSEDRSHRRGTRVPLRITDLVVPETIDEDIRVRVMKKKNDAMTVQDLREILAEIADRLKDRN